MLTLSETNKTEKIDRAPFSGTGGSTWAATAAASVSEEDGTLAAAVVVAAETRSHHATCKIVSLGYACCGTVEIAPHNNRIVRHSIPLSPSSLPVPRIPSITRTVTTDHLADLRPVFGRYPGREIFCDPCDKKTQTKLLQLPTPHPHAPSGFRNAAAIVRAGTVADSLATKDSSAPPARSVVPFHASTRPAPRLAWVCCLPCPEHLCANDQINHHKRTTNETKRNVLCA